MVTLSYLSAADLIAVALISFNVTVCDVMTCTGGLTQDQRLEAMSKLKQYQCRVLISTDLVRDTHTHPPLCCFPYVTHH